MKSLKAFAVLLAGLSTTPVFANDTMAQLGTGGLVFITSFDIRMVSEDLFVSREEVRVDYVFRNQTDKAQHVLIAFPLPDIQGSPDFMVSIPTEDPENIFGFETRFNGEPLEATLHQYVFGHGIDQTDLLRSLGLPLVPFGEQTRNALAALEESDLTRLEQLGLVVPLEYGDGETMVKEYFPAWTLKSTYSWEGYFPPGEDASVAHRYTPSVGATVATTFLETPEMPNQRHAEYQQKYCVDDGLYEAVQRTLPNPEEPYGAPYQEQWISYIWSTGGNWAGTVENFTLTIDKGEAEDLISFCWDGAVEKIGPTTFRASAENWFPPYGRELEILFLDKFEPML